MPWQPYAHSGACYRAIPHCSRPLPATYGHLGSPPRVPRGASTSGTRHAAGPLLLLPPLAPARTRAMAARVLQWAGSHARALTPLHSLSLFYPTWSTPTSTLDTT